MRNVIFLLTGILFLLTSVVSAQDTTRHILIPEYVIDNVIKELIIKDGLIYELDKKDSIITLYEKKDSAHLKQIEQYKLNEKDYKDIIENYEKLITSKEETIKSLEQTVKKFKIKLILAKAGWLGTLGLVLLGILIL